MGTILAETLEKLSRLFLGRIKIHRIRTAARGPIPISDARRTVSVQEVRSTPRVNAAQFFEWKTRRAQAAGALLGNSGGKAHRIPLRIAKKTARAIHLRLSNKKFLYCRTKRLDLFPIQRKNRLNFIKDPPKIAKGTILALFSPIIKEWVQRSVLDKSTGSLLLWYKPDRVRHKPQHLLLIRVHGAQKDPLQWVWLPINK